MTSYYPADPAVKTSTDSSFDAPSSRETGDSIAKRLIWLGPVGILVAVALSAGEWLVLREINASLAAAAGSLLLTAPVVLARRFPVTAISIVAAAAVLNGLLFGDLVRCALAFPAVLYISFAVGARAREGGHGWSWPVAGLVITFGAIFAQFRWDPALKAEDGFLVFGAVIATALWAAGLGWAAYTGRQRRARASTPGDEAV